MVQFHPAVRTAKVSRMEEVKMERTTVYLPLELKISIKAAARRRGSSEAEVIRDALTQYVQERERPRPKSIGIASRGRIQSENLEEWLAENWERD